MRALLAVLLLALPSTIFSRVPFRRSAPPAKVDNKIVESQSDFTGGLNTRFSSIHIAASEAQDIQNCYLDEKGIKKRSGSAKRNTTALGDGDDDVNAIGEWRKSDGTDYCIGVSSKIFYSSVDKCNSFTAVFSTLTAGEDVNCVAFQDRLYCVNGTDSPWYFDGTNDIPAGNMPTGKYIQVHQNRLWIAGVAGNLSRLYYSNVGDGKTWDTTLQYVDFNPEDGDVITGIGPPLFEVLPVYKKYSTHIIQGRQSADYTPVEVNSTIGAKSHRAIANMLVQGKNIQVFDSLGPKGSEPGIYIFNGIVVGYASAKIRDDFRNSPNFTTTAKFKLWTTQADWDTGTKNFMSTTIDVNTITPSTWTATDTSADDFGAGTLTTVSTNAVDGSITLRQGDNAAFTNAGAELNDTTTNVTVHSGRFAVDDGTIGCDLYGSYGWYRTVDLSYYRVEILDTGNNILLSRTDFVSTTATEYTIDTSTLAHTLVKFRVGDQEPVYALTSDPFICGTKFTYKIVDRGGSAEQCFDVDESQVVKTGNIVSQSFDTALTTPTWGLFEADFSSDALNTLTFQTQVSSDNSSWDSLTSATLDTQIASAQKQYIRYKASFVVTETTNTPAQLNDVTMSAASTGTWTSAETFLSDDLSTWGLLQGVESNTGDSCSWTYEIRASTYSGGTSAASWVTETNDSTISGSTGAYVQARLTNSFGVSTDVCKATSLTINYNEGAESQSAVAEVYKGRYYWFGQSSGGTENDISYVLDSNMAWTKLTGMYVRSAAIIDGGLYTGDSRTTSSGYVYKQDEGTSDDGTAVDAYWQGKDFLLTHDEIKKRIRDVYVTYIGSATTLGVTLYGDGEEIDSWNIDLSTSAPFGVKKCHVSTSQGQKRASYYSVKFSNSDEDEGFSVLGYRLHWEPVGLLRP